MVVHLRCPPEVHPRGDRPHCFPAGDASYLGCAHAHTCILVVDALSYSFFIFGLVLLPLFPGKVL